MLLWDELVWCGPEILEILGKDEACLHEGLLLDDEFEMLVEDRAPLNRVLLGIELLPEVKLSIT